MIRLDSSGRRTVPQLPQEDAARIAALCGSLKAGQSESHNTGLAESHIIPDMTHILRKEETGEGAVAILKGYKQAGTRDIDPQLLALLRVWLERFARV